MLEQRIELLVHADSLLKLWISFAMIQATRAHNKKGG